MKTTHPQSSASQWIILDASDKSIGAVAVTAASILRGKHRPQFSPHQAGRDHVVVINARALRVHPAKKSQKQYRHHTGYFGHMTVERLRDILQTRPGKAIERAVWGMLPKNRLRSNALRRLHVFDDAEHSFAAQKPSPLTVSVSRGLPPSS